VALLDALFASMLVSCNKLFARLKASVKTGVTREVGHSLMETRKISNLPLKEMKWLCSLQGGHFQNIAQKN